MANGNGKSASSLPHADGVLASAILDLCEDVKVETIKLEGLARAVLHRRVVTGKQFRSQVLASIQAIGDRHLRAVERARAQLGEG